jgi:hypothetical protein
MWERLQALPDRVASMVTAGPVVKRKITAEDPNVKRDTDDAAMGCARDEDHSRVSNIKI